MSDGGERRETAIGRRGVELMQIGGIRILIDYSWILIFLLVLWSLSAGYLPRALPEQSAGAYWAAGLAATLLFFVSILAHELSHAFTAMRYGIRIPAITLFVFGGVSHMEEEPDRAGTELKIALMGPLMSFALAGVFYAVYVAITPQVTGLAAKVVQYLAWINAALGVFNLLPGFPLDGGRVLRAIAWWKTGSLARGTKLASDVGKGLAIGLMLLGAVEIFAGALIGGLWLIFIGMFLRGMAQAGYQNLVIRQAISDVSVEDVMIRDPVTVPPETSVRRLIDEYFLGYGYRGFPVVDDGKVLGVISIDAARAVPPGERDSTRVRDCMEPVDDARRIEAGASLAEALRKMSGSNVGRLLALRGDRLQGMVTKTGLARFIELRQVLEK